MNNRLIEVKTSAYSHTQRKQENSDIDPSEFKAFALSYNSTLPLYPSIQNPNNVVK